MDYLMLLSEVGELSSVSKVRTYLKKLEDFSSSNPSKKTDFSSAFCFDRNKKQANKRLKVDSDAEKDEDVLPHPEKVNHPHPVNNESQNQDQQAKPGGGASNEPAAAAVGATATTPASAAAGGVPGRKRCKCKRSRCLKFYCECFAANQFCVEGDCICKDCWNTNYSWHAQAREDAIMLALEKRPDAFSDRFEAVPARLACHCKKSNCLKKYCDCYAAGRYCSEVCGCVACLNNEAHFKEKQAMKDQMTAANPAGGGGEGGPLPSPSASPPAASNKSRQLQQQSPVQMMSSAGGVIPPLPFRGGSPGTSRAGGGSLVQAASPGQRQAPAPHSLIHSSSPPPGQFTKTAVFMGSNGMPTMMAAGNMATPVAMMGSGQQGGMFAARGMGVTGGSSAMLATALQHQAMMMMSQNAVNSSAMAPMGNRTPTPNMPQHQPSSSPMQSMQHLVNRVPTPNMTHQASTSPIQPMQQQMLNRAATPTGMMMANPNPNTTGTSPVLQTSPSQPTVPQQ